VLSAVAKAYLVLAAVLGAFALVYLDPLSLGPGGGGDHFGGTLLVSAAMAAVCYAVVTSFRAVTDDDVERPLGADAPPPTVRPVTDHGPAVGASAFPLLAALGLVLFGVAAATGSVIAYLATAVLFVAGAGWLGQAFTEHPLTTARLGDRLSRRTTSPFTYPVLAVFLGGVVAVSVSRIYLTITEAAAIVVSGLLATVLFVGCLVLASSKDVGRRLTAGLGGLALVSIVGAGAASAARGERTIEHHASGEVTEVEIKAEGIQYDTSELTLYEGKVEFTFENDDPKGTFHNVGVYSSKEAGEPFVAILALDGGTRGKDLIDTKVVGLAPGASYFFRCDFHPAMVGTLRVEAGRPPGSGDGHGGEQKEEKH
jgi:hypothetical protein